MAINRQLRLPDSLVDFTHGIFQEIQIPVTLINSTLPVPLVHIQRMQIVKVLVRTDCVHVSIKSESGRNIVCTEFHTLPLRK